MPPSTYRFLFVPLFFLEFKSLKNDNLESWLPKQVVDLIEYLRKRNIYS